VKKVYFEHNGRMTYVAELAREIGMSPRAVRLRKLKGAPLDVPSQRSRLDIEKLKRLAEGGLQSQEIARRMNSHGSAIRLAMRRHGIYRAWQRKRYKQCAA
jgi:hypothetical protein